MRQEKEIELPEWLDPQVWSDYLDVRFILKKPMTKRAKELAIMRLDRLRKVDSPRAIVDQSADKGWYGLFPVNDFQPDFVDKTKDQFDGSL